MSERMIKPEPLTAKAFAPYGDVIACSDTATQRQINYDHTTRFHDLAALDLNKEGGKPLVNIFRSTPLERPIPIKVMERHLLSSQVFYPLSNNPYMIVVAEQGAFNPDNLKAFLASATQGVNYHAGVWHHYSLALNEVSDFFVIDRGGPEKDCDEIFIGEDNAIRIDY